MPVGSVDEVDEFTAKQRPQVQGGPLHSLHRVARGRASSRLQRGSPNNDTPNLRYTYIHPHMHFMDPYIYIYGQCTYCLKLSRDIEQGCVRAKHANTTRQREPIRKHTIRQPQKQHKATTLQHATQLNSPSTLRTQCTECQKNKTVGSTSKYNKTMRDAKLYGNKHSAHKQCKPMNTEAN